MTGRTLHHYRFLEKLGEGGMSDVYKAHDTRLNRFVAIKVLTNANSGDPNRRRRFIQEAQAASALNHPSIITIYDILDEGDEAFLVLEYVQGKTLEDAIPKGGLRSLQILAYAVQMTDALQAAHAARIIHRDLKPKNIMVTEAGLVKILDFGLAKLTDRGPLGDSDDTSDTDETKTIGAAPLTIKGTILGTYSYMSPEQAQGRPVDARSDIFSLGLVLYEMATGVRAFSGTSVLATLSAILRDEARPIAEIVPEIPSQLELVISRCLPKDPADRWQSMTDLHRAFAALKHQTESVTSYRTPPTDSLEITRAYAAASGVASAPSVAPSQVSLQSAATHFASSHTYPPATSAAWPPLQQSSVATSVPGSPAQQPKRPPAGLILGLVAAFLLVSSLGATAWWLAKRSPSSPDPVATAQPASPVEIPPAPVATPASPPVPSSSAAEVPKRTAPSNSQPVPRKSEPAPPIAPPETATAPQTETAPAASPPPAPPETPAPSTVPVVVRDGSTLGIELAEDIPVAAEPGRALKFVTTTELRLGDKQVVAKGALVRGQIVEGAQKRLFRNTKTTLRLLDVEAVGGQKIAVRVLAGRRPDGKHELPVDPPVKPKSKDVLAQTGTPFVAYINGDQTIQVSK